VRTCGYITSQNFDTCISSCDGNIGTKFDCTYVSDRCSCLANNCGWCENSVTLAGSVTDVNTGSATTVVSVGTCASTTSQLQCVTADSSFSVASSVSKDNNTGTVTVTSSSIGIPPTNKRQIATTCDPKLEQPLVPVTIVSNDNTANISKCLADARCTSTGEINLAINETAKGTDAGNKWTIVVTIVIQSSDKGANVGVDVTGNTEPNASDLTEICNIVATGISNHLKFDSDRVHECLMAKVSSGSLKRSVSNSYVASIGINDPATGNFASAIVPSLVALGAAALALVF